MNEYEIRHPGSHAEAFHNRGLNRDSVPIALAASKKIVGCVPPHQARNGTLPQVIGNGLVDCLLGAVHRRPPKRCRSYVTEPVPPCDWGMSGVGTGLVPDFLFLAAALDARRSGGFISGRAGA